MKRALFYFHSIKDTRSLLPVFHVLKNSGEFEIAFTIHPLNKKEHAGLPPTEEQILRAYNPNITNNPQQFKPEITFLSEFQAHLFQNCGKLIYLSRSLSSKGRFSPASKLLDYYNLFDTVCVPGEFYKDRLDKSNRVFIPVSPTGFTPLDPRLSPGYPSTAGFKQQAGLDSNSKIILYAPTWEMELSSLPVLWTRIGILAEESSYLFIKFHPDTPDFFVESVTKSLQGHPRIKLISNYDLLPYLRIADVIVSDTSSVWLESIALNKPVVLFDNPNKVMLPEFDSSDPEYSFRDACIVANNLEDVVRGVKQSLRFPDELEAKRENYLNRIISNSNGDAALKVIESAYTVLEKKGKTFSIPTTDTALLIPVENEEQNRKVAAIINSVIEKDFPVKIHILADESCRVELNKLLDSKYLDNIVFCEPDLENIVSNIANNPITIILKPAVELTNDSLFRLSNHLRRNKNLDCVFPLAINGSPEQEPSNLFGLDSKISKDLNLIDNHVKFSFIAQSTKPENFPRTNIFTLLTHHLLENNSLFASLFSEDSSIFTGLKIAVAHDVAVKYPEVFDLNNFNGTLTDTQRTDLEKRVKELSDWISASVKDANPDPIRESSMNSANGDKSGTRKKMAEEDGNLRLALHYERRGKLDEARKQIQLALNKNNPSDKIKEVAQRLGVDMVKEEVVQ